MRELEQWLCWRFERREGKQTKVPISPHTGSRASSTDPATWASFSEAVQARKEHGYSGIGFVFSENDPYCGVDLDNCRDSETGQLEEWAHEIVEELASYTEISPSGRGVHIICRGDLPAGRNRKGSVEAYSSKRFFTVTGKRLEGTPEIVEDRTQELQNIARRVFGEAQSNSPGGNGHALTGAYRDSRSSLEDEELIRRASEAKDGGKFRELFSGGYCGHASHSEAVAALLLKLAFWSGRDALQMEKVFRRSGLMYEKFDSRRGETTWGAQEIQKAIDKAQETYSAPARLTFGAGVGVKLSSADANGHATENGDGHAELSETDIGKLLSEVEPERVSWLWPGRIPLGKLSLIDGDPGTGKSGITGDLAARVSAGLPLPDGYPLEAGGVVLLSAEDGLADTIRPRLDAAGADADKVLSLATTEDAEGYERMLSIPEDLHLIERGIRRVGAKLVVVDPLMAFLSGEANAHKDQDTRKALAPLATLAERTGAAVVVVRHLNKATGGNALYRGGGSIGIIGAARSALLVAKDPEDENRRVLAPMKSNLAQPAPSLAFTLEEADNGAVRVVWQGGTDLDAAKLLATSAAKEEGDASSEATEFLQDLLRDGPVFSKRVWDEARDLKISEPTLKRAKKSLGVEAVRESVAGEGRGAGRWMWELPRLGAQPQEVQDVQRDHDSQFDPLERGRRDKQPENPIYKPNLQGDRVDDSSRGSRGDDPLERRPPPLTEEQTRQIQKLISQGIEPSIARREVLDVEEL